MTAILFLPPALYVFVQLGTSALTNLTKAYLHNVVLGLTSTMNFISNVIFWLISSKMTFCLRKLTKAEIVEQYHSPEGCIPYKELPKFYNHNIKRSNIVTPAWCENLLPPNVTSKPETSKAFEIRTLQLRLSNYINATVKPIGKAQALSEVYMTARRIDLLTNEFDRKVGRFVPGDNTHLVCCNYIDRNAILIFGNGSPTVTVRWWPDGDYVGLFVFQATIITEDGKYWVNVQSNITMAIY